MMKPLKSADPNPQNVQFSHFGVLNDGSNSKSAFFGSFILNGTIVLLAIIVSAAAVNKVEHKEKLTEITLAPKEEPKPPKPPPPKIVPPKPLPEPPKPIEPPKIQPPPVQLPPDIKPIVVPTPKVNLAPPAPKKVDPPPAPKVVSLAAHAASVVNNDVHPSAVRLGSATSPVSPKGPAVSNVNLSAGMAHMPASNSGNGPASRSVNLGSGSPQGTNLNGRSNAVVPVKGLNSGVPGGTGTGNRGPVSVQIAPQQTQVAAARPTVASPMAHPPVITYTPKPVYSAEAKSLNLEGEARVSVRLNANGSVQVLGLVRGLGHGLDQSALAAAQGIRFRPATDASGHPMDFPTTVVIRFAIN